MKKEIEPCLQCANDRIDLAGDFKKFYLVCRECGNEGKSSASIHQANEYWNQYQIPFDFETCSVIHNIKQLH